MSKETDCYCDADYAGWLVKLDKMESDLTDWEYLFVGNCLNRGHFTDKQREVILNMVEKYL